MYSGSQTEHHRHYHHRRKGEFIVNTSFRDSTTFLVQARTKRGFAGVDIVIDTPQYPATSHKSPFHDGTATFMEDYLLNTRDQYYMEGGMRVYNLKEVVVTGSRKKASSESIYTGGINTYTIEGDRLEGFGAQTAFDAVTRLPGISVTMEMKYISATIPSNLSLLLTTWCMKTITTS